MRSKLLSPSSLAGLLALSLAACSKTPTPPTTDAGPPPVDTCNTADTAKDDPTCQLALGGDALKGFIYPAGDRDWYHLKLPADLPPRALLNVHTGYSAPSSPVTLTANVIGTDGQSSLGTGVDPRLHGEPTLFDVVVRLGASAAGADYYVLLADDPSDNDDPAHGDFDRKNGYTLTASVSSDPDVHEPNDTEATATGLAVGEGSQASIDGALATTGDEDYYLLDVSTSASRPILYLDLTAPALTPAPLTRVSFLLYPQGDPLHPIAQGSSKSPVGIQEVATARLLPSGGKYVLVVKGNKERDTDPPPPGDIRLVYTLKAQVFPDLDANEPNDDIAHATVASLAVGDTKAFQGRIAYVPDADWYAIDVQASGQNARLSFSVSFPSGGDPGRFPATDKDAIHNRILNVVTLPTSVSDCVTTCPGDPQIKQDYCGRSTSQCARSIRYENTMYAGLDNFLGVVPVPQHSGVTRYYFNLQPRSLDAANDQVYELKVQVLPESSDEQSAYRDTPAEASTQGIPWLSTYNPNPGTGLTVTGQISYGLLQRSDSPADNSPLLAKAPPDYDAKSDADLYQLILPQQTVLPDAGYDDVSLSFAWKVGQGNTRSNDVTLNFFFCDVTDNPGCAVTGKWHVAPLGYKAGPLHGWQGGAVLPTYDFDKTQGTFQGRPEQCFCVEKRFVNAGKVYLQVGGVDRSSYGDDTYNVHAAVGPYPQGYTDTTGPVTCSLPCKLCSGSNGDCDVANGLPGSNP